MVKLRLVHLMLSIPTSFLWAGELAQEFATGINEWQECGVNRYIKQLFWGTMSTENKGKLEGTWSAIHESVIVGYFCQAVGYLIRKAEEATDIDEVSRMRLAEAINLSHNPFDPAVGDIVLRLQKTNDFPKEYFIFEIKLEWLEGIMAERAKFEKKWKLSDSSLPAIANKAIDLCTGHPKALKAHLFGALERKDPAHAGNTLLVHPYWEAICEGPKSTIDRVPVMPMLNRMFNGDMSGSGFTAKELVSYVKALNEGSEEGSKAHQGSLRLVYAVNSYGMYLLQERKALELAMSAPEPKVELTPAKETPGPKSSSTKPGAGRRLGGRG